jgi:hypothetical protein
MPRTRLEVLALVVLLLYVIFTAVAFWHHETHHEAHPRMIVLEDGSRIAAADSARYFAVPPCGTDTECGE